MASEELFDLCHGFFLGRQVVAQHGRFPEHVKREPRSSLVGQQHELLDELVRRVRLIDEQIRGLAGLVIELEGHLGGGGELQGALAEALRSDLDRQRVEVADGLCDVGPFLDLPVQVALGIGVRKLGGGVDHGLRKALRDDLALRGQLHEARERQVVFVGSQGADVRGQQLGQHVDAPVYEVHRGAASRRLFVERCTGQHEVRHICDVDPNGEVTVVQPHARECVVDVLALRGVDGEHQRLAYILAPFQFLLRDLVVAWGQACQNLVSPWIVADLVLHEDHLCLHVDVADGAQGLDELPPRDLAVTVPNVDGHQHALALKVCSCVRRLHKHVWKPQVRGYEDPLAFS
mmetsp:Transcript_71857/g.206320  ORF Transcript_71857/g.206320 Transcript_71857/m.206320 type:complete len:347 (+) Transcript_71857:856-1896(+)